MHIPQFIKDILYSVFLVVVFLLWKGYVFNTADQVEPLLLVYQKLNPSLYQGDLYVDAAKDIFTVRYYFVHLIVFFSRFSSVEAVCFAGTFLSLLMGMLGLIHITRTLTKGQLSGYFVPFFVSFVFISWTIGGNVLQYHLFIASNVAKALGIWGIYFLLNRKYLVSGALVGIAGLFQILVGLQLACIILAVMILMMQWKSAFKWGFAWLIFTLPMLAPIFQRQFLMSATDLTDPDVYYHLLYKFRNPQHYLPSLFPVKDFIKAGLLAVSGSVLLGWFLSRKQWIKTFLFALVIILGMIVYSVSIEVLQIQSIGKLQWFKTSIWLAAVSAMGFGIAMEYLWKQYISSKYILLIAFVLPLIWLVRDHYRFDTPVSFDHRTDEQKELSLVHDWVLKNTDEKALFATYVRDESFSCEAKRPSTAMIVPMVHEPWYMVKWYERFHLQYGVTDTLHDLSEMRKLADTYYETGRWLKDLSPDYCIVKRNIDFPQSEIAFESQNFKVLKFNHARSSER